MPWGLRPSRIVNTRDGLELLAHPRGKPAIVEQHEQGSDANCVRQLQECLNPGLKAFSIDLPDEVMEKDPNAVHANFGSPLEFPGDRFRIEGLGLPHFELVTGRAWREVSAHPPRLLERPTRGALPRPSLSGHTVTLPGGLESRCHNLAPGRPDPQEHTLYEHSCEAPVDFTRLKHYTLCRGQAWSLDVTPGLFKPTADR